VGSHLLHFAPDSRAAAQQLPAILTGPVVTDALGLPRYAATIWIDFLHGHLAAHTRSAYRRAATALYRQAEQCVPAIDLDLALLSPNLPDVERVLSAFLLTLQIGSGVATNLQWRLARSFVFDHWGWFDAKQTWLPKNDDRKRRESFVDFITSLVQAAREGGQRVDAVVLPELALNYVQFRSLANALARDAKIDFLISGVSHDQHQRAGNFVAIAPFFLLGDERDAAITGWERLVLVREKHHRWKLERSQIDAYGLNLDPDKSWWESLRILSRSLDVMVYRGRSTLTTLICEDLARVDPCQAVVRAIGPNLLIALLMDGPQLSARWPGRYATVLAEDPGTSVLSFTSFGLIARQNDQGKFPQASGIALWKDEATGARTLELPREADALVLSLIAVAKTERTLDGRTDDGSSHRWEYENHKPVKTMQKPDWIRTGRGRD